MICDREVGIGGRRDGGWGAAGGVGGAWRAAHEHGDRRRPKWLPTTGNLEKQFWRSPGGLPLVWHSPSSGTHRPLSLVVSAPPSPCPWAPPRRRQGARPPPKATSSPLQEAWASKFDKLRNTWSSRISLTCTFETRHKRLLMRRAGNSSDL